MCPLVLIQQLPLAVTVALALVGHPQSVRDHPQVS